MSRSILANARYSNDVPFNNRARSEQVVLNLPALNWQQFSGATNIGVTVDPDFGNVITFTRPAGTTPARIYADITPTNLSAFRGLGFYTKFPLITAAGAENLASSIYFVNSGTNAYYSISFGGGIYKNGWYYYALDWSSMTVSGSPDNTAINRIWLYASNGVAPSAQSDTVSFGPCVNHVGSRTSVIISHDDGNDSDYTYVYPYCQARGLKACSGVYTNHPTSDVGWFGLGGALTRAQMDEMYASKSHEFLNHTRNGNSLNPALTNPITGTNLTAAQQAEQITTCRDFLRANYPSGADILIYPGGWHDWDLIVLAKSLGVKVARSAGGLNPGGRFVTSLRGTMGRHTIQTITIGENNTVAQVIAAIDAAIAARANLIVVYGHGVSVAAAIPPTGLSIHPTSYGQILDHIALRKRQGLIDNPLFSEWAKCLDGPLA